MVLSLPLYNWQTLLTLKWDEVNRIEDTWLS